MFQRWQNQNGYSETTENWECGLGTERAKREVGFYFASNFIFR